MRRTERAGRHRAVPPRRRADPARAEGVGWAEAVEREDLEGTERATGTPPTGRQAAWNYLVFALSKSSTLLMTIVLARLLGPAEFGLFAFALLIVNLFDYVKDLGVGAALVQSRRDWGRIAPTGLLLSVGFGVTAGGLLAATAGFTASLLGHPDLTPLIRVLAIGLTISALSAIPAARLRRNIDFRGRLMPEFSGALTKTVLTIALAAAGHGVWSLVYGQLAGVVVTTTLYWVVARTSPRIEFDAGEARELIRFGLPVTAVTLLAFAIYNVDYLAIGTRLGDTELGLYTLAYRLPELLVLNLCIVISEVLFSSLSRLQHDRAALARHYVQALTAVVALTAPIGIGLAVAADPLVGTLYGPDYADAVPMLAIIAIYTVVYSASFHSGDVYKAIGRPGILTAINAAKLAVLVVPIWWAAGHSAVAVALVLLGVECVHFVARMWIVRGVLDLHVPDLASAVLRPLVAAAVMAAVLLGVDAVLDAGSGLPDPAWLAVLVVTGAGAYVVALRFAAPRLFANAVAIVRSATVKSRAPRSAPLEPRSADASVLESKGSS